jgi:hypothetical protein
MSALLKSGTCRVCGCTEDRACELVNPEDFERYTCSWIDIDETLCSNPRCMAVIPIEDLIFMSIEASI